MRAASVAPPPALAVAVALFLIGSQFYTNLAALAPQAVPYVVLVPPTGAWLLFVLLVACGLYCAFAALRKDAGADASPVPLRAMLLTATVCAVFGFDPVRSLGSVVLLALACAMHAATIRFFAMPGFATVVLGSFLGLGIAACGAALVMQATRMPLMLALVNNERAAGPFTTPNQFAAFLVTFIAACCATGLGAPTARLRIFGWAGAAVGLVSLWATFSRGGWFGFAVAVVAFFVFLRAWRLASVALVAAVLLGMFALGTDSHHEASDAYARVPALEAGVTMVALFPLLGVGPAAYDRVHPAVRPTTAQNEAAYASLHPHNIFISLLAEEGVVGFAVIGFAAVRFGTGMRSRLLGAQRQRRLAAFALGAGLVGTLAHGMVDLVAIAEITFVWVPFSALALAVASHGFPE